MSPRISVARGDTEFEATVRWEGRYLPATRLDPEEFPDPVIDEVWRDGVKMRPDFIPDDVAEEILRLAFTEEAEEPDPPGVEAWEQNEYP